MIGVLWVSWAILWSICMVVVDEGCMGEERGSRRHREAGHQWLERRLTGREGCRRGAHDKGEKRVG
ncbi:hypothetical protein OIU78_029619 [Salix suchowensis]|nr:hypothetical protein OIU78_029619 [Salix suchowensis]